MQNYQGSKCPFCGEEFKEGQDIVVCPECGTPHHRSCYFEHSCCANADKHDSGFTWKAEAVTEQNADDGETVTCKSCGREISAGSVFCRFCGTPLNQELEQRGFALGSMPFINQPSMFKDDEIIDGISVRDWKTSIGSNSEFYIYNFKNQVENHKSTGFVWSTLFFPVVYFLYRKVWLTAACAALVNWITAIPSALYMLYAYYGIDFGISVNLLSTLSTVSQVALWSINAMWAVFGVYFYRKTLKRRILRCREKNPDDVAYQTKLRSSGGPSKLAVIIYCVAIVLAYIGSMLLATMG